MMARIAVIFEGRLHDRKGVFNAVMNRVKHLRAIAPFEIDVHLIEGYDRGLNRWLHRTRRITERPEVAHIDMVDVHTKGSQVGVRTEESPAGIDVQMHWFRHSLMDSFRHKVLHRPASNYLNWLSHLADELKGYDLISAHDRIAGTAAAMAGERYAIPHFITWHGASIYTDPPRDALYRQATIGLLRQAKCNFFVSHGLERFARQTLCDDFGSAVLYNGASAEFHRLDNETRQLERRLRGIADDERVVGFVGRMEPVKNVMLLPELFSAIRRAYDGSLKFVALGDGSLLTQVRRRMIQTGIDCLMPGAVPHSTMPAWMNCIDVLVLPSRLEGLPLVALEAIQCGASVVTTDVIGIAEAVGKENALALDEHLIDNMVRRTVQMLEGEVTQTVPPDMNWETTAQRELAIYLNELKTEN